MSNSLKFLLDENVRIEVKEFLKKKGFSVEYVPKSSTNHEVASLAREKKLVFITHDTDFTNPFLYSPKEFSGIIVLGISPSLLREILTSLERLLSEVKEFSGKLIVLEEEGFKIVS